MKLQNSFPFLGYFWVIKYLEDGLPGLGDRWSWHPNLKPQTFQGGEGNFNNSKLPEVEKRKPDFLGIVKCCLGGETSNIFIFSSRYLGKMIQFDGHIFQMGWFNHQLYSCTIDIYHQSTYLYRNQNRKVSFRTPNPPP